MGVNPGDTVRFKPGREGSFKPEDRLVVKDVLGHPDIDTGWPWFTADVGKHEWFLSTDRVEAVSE